MTERPLNIILVGKTGCGKSSTGNFIVGKKVFKSKRSLKSTTKEISVANTPQDGIKINVVDTPGLFDTDENLFETALKIQTSLNAVSPGPHAFLIVIDGSQKYTEEERKTQHIIQLTFGEKIFKHALIILTHEDQYDSSEELLREAEFVPELQTLISLCGGRRITLNNLSTDRNYKTGIIKNIIKEVNAISKNGNDCYTEDLTAYTQALKEHANKKTDNKDLTVGLLDTVLKKADAEAKRLATAAYVKGKAVGMASEIATGIATGVAVGVGGIVVLGTLGLGCYMISKNPDTVVNVLKPIVGITGEILKEVRKHNNQDMHSSRTDWRSEQLHFQQSLEKVSCNGAILEEKRKRDNQDMHSTRIDWRSEQLHFQQSLEKLSVNAPILVEKFKRDNQDMHSSRIYWRSEQLRLQQRLEKMSFNGK